MQIYTKGRVSNEEILQLTEAGVPAYKILEEQLGLTKEQLSSLGDAGIEANVAIEALLAGMEQRFGGAMGILSNTMQGLASNFIDSFKYLGATLLEPLHESVKNTLRNINKTLSDWTVTVQKSGIGGLFNQIIPPELQGMLRQLIANLDGLRNKFIEVWNSAKPLVMALVQIGINIANLVLPVIYAFMSALSYLFQVVSENEVLFRIFTGAVTGLLVFTIVNKTVSAFISLLKPLSSIGSISSGFMAAAKSGGILAAVMGALKGGVAGVVATVAAVGAGVAAMSGVLNNASTALGTLTGYKGEDYLKPTFKDDAKSADKYTDSLGNTEEGIKDTAKATDKLGDSAKKAGEKAQDALMSFDEVFEIEPPDETTDPSGMGDIGGIGAPSIGTPTMPSGPDWAGFGKEYNDKLNNALQSNFNPTRWFDQLWIDVKNGFNRVAEFITGFVQIFSNAIVSVFRGLQGIIGTVILFVTGQWDKIKPMWESINSDIQVRWAKTMSNLNMETSKAMELLKNTTLVETQALKETFDLALKDLPKVTEENIGEVAGKFTTMLRALDEDSLTILRGTSDSMAVLFKGIKADMSNEEATNQFIKNIKNMSNTGMLDANKLATDFDKAMKKINGAVTTEVGRAEQEAERLFGLMLDNEIDTAENMVSALSGQLQIMSDSSIQTLKDMGGGWATIFDGIESDADFSSQEIKNKLVENISKAREDGTLNFEELQKFTATKFKQMVDDTNARTQELVNVINDGTLDASKFAKTNAKQIVENIELALKEAPPKSKKEMEAAKKEMVNQLVDAKVLTTQQGEQIVGGISGELSKTPGKAKTIFGVDLKKAISDTTETLKKTTETVAEDSGTSFVTGILTSLDATVFSGSWWWDQIWSAIKAIPGKIKDALTPKKEKTGTQSIQSFSMQPTSSFSTQSNSPNYQPRQQSAFSFSREGMMNRNQLHSVAASYNPLTNTVDSTLEELVGNRVSESMAQGLAMQSQMFNSASRNMYGNQGIMGGNNPNQVIINAYSYDDSSLRVLLRRLRLIAEKEKNRTFGTMPSVF